MIRFYLFISTYIDFAISIACRIVMQRQAILSISFQAISRDILIHPTLGAKHPIKSTHRGEIYTIAHDKQRPARMIPMHGVKTLC